MSLEDEFVALEAIYGEDFKRGSSAAGEPPSFEINVRPDASGVAGWPPPEPLALQFILPTAYPAEAPLVVSRYKNSWVRERDLQEICENLQSISIEANGEGHLFQQIEWVRENATRLYEDARLELQQKSPPDRSGSTASQGSAGRSECEEARQQPPKPQPEPPRCPCPPIHTGDPITDRKSKFVAHVAAVHSDDEVRAVIAKLYEDKKIANATHNIAAWRFRVGESQWEEARDDDGETGAGDKLLALLVLMDVRDALVVVTRWFGGIQLGPDRFKHINERARVTLEKFGFLSAAAAEGQGHGKAKGHGHKK
eukprot:tig00000367_g24475.t1